MNLTLNVLKRKYSRDVLQQVLYCRDEIRGLVMQDRLLGYSDDEIEDRMGKYLDEVYNDYLKVANTEYGLTEQEFDDIYVVLENIEGEVKL